MTSLLSKHCSFHVFLIFWWHFGGVGHHKQEKDIVADGIVGVGLFAVIVAAVIIVVDVIFYQGDHVR